MTGGSPGRPADTGLSVPAVILAADHRARGVITIERYDDLRKALVAALPHCDGILATAQPLGDLASSGALGPDHRTYLSLNRTGLAGSAFELDDRLVTSVWRAAEDGWSGVKHMTRIDPTDPMSAGALELLGQVLDEARGAGLEALVEAVVWRNGAMARDVDAVAYAAVVAHDMGAPLLKVPVPDAPAGSARQEAVARVVASVGVPVLFLGGPRREEGREPLLAEVRDVMAGGGAGMAVGRGVYQDPDPAGAARAVADIVHAGVASAVILTVDFGTSVTKVALWSEDGLVVLARAELATARPEVGWAEQDPFGWWTAVVVACAEARAAAPDAFGAVEVVSCSAARQTFVPLTASAEPLGKGLVWSDRRAVAEAAALAASLGGNEAVRRRTGVPLDGGAVAAKIAWIAAHQPGRLAACDWLLSPRDLVVWRLTGEVLTDATLASRTGLYDADGEPVPELVGPAAGKLPPVVAPDHVAGGLRAVPAAELGLPPGIPVVIGAGDRQCEVLGAGASLARPMVSWGTTANVSVPVGEVRPDPVPAGAVLSRAATGGWLLEGGLSAAGSFLAWLGRIVGRHPDELARLASASPPGARGVVAVPWLDGARAPWWRDDARAGFLGLGAAHEAGDLARATLESVAWEVRRCLVAVTSGPTGAGPPVGLTLGGAGTGIPLWVDVLTSVTGLSASRRRSGEAASAGAALLAAAALGRDLPLDRLDPVVDEIVPDPEGVEVYRKLEEVADRVAGAVIDLGPTTP